MLYAIQILYSKFEPSWFSIHEDLKSEAHQGLPSFFAGGCSKAKWFSRTWACPVVWQTSQSTWNWLGLRVPSPLGFLFLPVICVLLGFSPHPTLKKNSLGLYLACLCIYWPQCKVQHLRKVSESVSCFSSAVSLRIIWDGLLCGYPCGFLMRERRSSCIHSHTMTFVSAWSLSNIALSSQSINKYLLSAYYECPVVCWVLWGIFFKKGERGERERNGDRYLRSLKACYHEIDMLWGFLKMNFCRGGIPEYFGLD